MSLHVAPCSAAEANDYVKTVHRHNGTLPTSIFRVLVHDDERIVRGVAIAGAPKARMLMTPGTLEVSRVATDGSRNACSMLYGACTRAARALGYRRLVTYTLEIEAGASLRASGWSLTSRTKAESWSRRQAAKGNPDYVDGHDAVTNKWRSEIQMGEPVPELIWPNANTGQHAFDFGEPA